MKQLYSIFFSLLLIPALAQVQDVDLTKTDSAVASEARSIQSNQGFDKIVGTHENQEEKFSVSYGNGFLQFANPQGEILRIQLMNITGKVVRNTLISDKDAQLYVNDLTPGLYLVRAEDRSGHRAVRKVYLR